LKICTTCGGSFDEDVMMCPNDGTPLFASAVVVEDDPEEVEESSIDDAAILPLVGAQSPEGTVEEPVAAETAEPVAAETAEPVAAETAEEAETSEAAAQAPPQDEAPDAVVMEAEEAMAGAAALEAPPHTDTEEIIASLLAAEDPATPAPEEDELPEPVQDFEDSSELPEVVPLPVLDPMPGPEITDAPTPVPAEDAPSESVLDLIEDSIADDSAIHGLPTAEQPVSLEDAKSKKVVIPAKVEPKASGGNKAIVVVAVVLVLAILAAVGYFFVLPLLGG
jgi:hypothetical protein